MIQPAPAPLWFYLFVHKPSQTLLFINRQFVPYIRFQLSNWYEHDSYSPWPGRLEVGPDVQVLEVVSGPLRAPDRWEILVEYQDIRIIKHAGRTVINVTDRGYRPATHRPMLTMSGQVLWAQTRPG